MERVSRGIRALLVLAAALCAPAVLYAAGDVSVPSQLESVAQSIQEIVTGPFITIIVAIILAGCGIAYAYNKDNEKIKAKIIEVAVGAVIIAAAKETAAMLIGS